MATVGRSVAADILAYLWLVCIISSSVIAADTSVISTKSADNQSPARSSQAYRWPLPQVNLLAFAALRCSGVLIDLDWVLTAASCFDGNYRPENYNINLLSGDDDKNASHQITSTSSSGTQNEQNMYVDSFYIHGRYTVGNNIAHNLALIHLHHNATSGYATADVIGAHHDVNSNECLSMSWEDENGGPATAAVRKWSVMNNTLCAQNYNISVHPYQLCAQFQDTDGVVPCIRGSGSPVVCKVDGLWKVTAIVGNGNCQKSETAKFLNLQYYLSFVEKRGHFKNWTSLLPAEL